MCNNSNWSLKIEVMLTDYSLCFVVYVFLKCRHHIAIGNLMTTNVMLLFHVNLLVSKDYVLEFRSLTTNFVNWRKTKKITPITVLSHLIWKSKQWKLDNFFLKITRSISYIQNVLTFSLVLLLQLLPATTIINSIRTWCWYNI